MRYIVLFALLGLLSPSFSQTGGALIAIDFNDCQIQDAGVQNVSLLTGGAPQCVCGLEGDALRFDGLADYLSISQDISDIFSKDFTISFYIKIENKSGIVDVFSFLKECKRDSSFTLRYIPSINECRLDIVKNLSLSSQINFKLEDGKCWQHIVLVRDKFEYLAYVNGQLAGSTAAKTDYVFSPSAFFSFANSPCLSVSETRFEGDIEHFQIFGRALNVLEISRLNLFPDQIMNNDTTLLLGEQLQIEMGPSCADQIFWTNTQDLDDPSSFEPLITPTESSVYVIDFYNGSCISFDSISIYIQDPEELVCDQLLLPNAFSPNGDNLNESFGISNKFIVDRIKSFDIYSKSGARVFHGTEKHDGWDGSYQGSLLNPAKFVYVINYECGGQEYQKRGIVNLIR